MAENPRSFSPTQVEANRTRQQGGGVGQRELSGQRDAGEDINPSLDLDAVDELEAEGHRQGVGHRADKAPSDREHGKKPATTTRTSSAGGFRSRQHVSSRFPAGEDRDP